MMNERLTPTRVRDLLATRPDADRDVWDAGRPGLVLRLRPSGVHSWRVRLPDRRWKHLGRADELTLTVARSLALYWRRLYAVEKATR